MKKLTILSVATIAGIFLAGPLHAVGNARTLTTGIGAGTVPSGVPTNHPYSSKRQSTNTRNSRAEISAYNFRTGGFSNRPESTSSVSSAGSAPTEISGNIPGDSHAAGVVPSSIGGAGSAGFATPPTTIPGNSNASISTNAPLAIGGGAVANTPPTFTAPPSLIPATPAFPDAASTGAGNMPSQIGRP